jgi:PAS domain S-box-containing protein
MSDAPAQRDLHTALQALHDSEERYRRLLSGLRDYAVFMLDREGRVISWNAGAEHVIGYRSDEIIGHNFSCIRTPEDIERRLHDEELRLALDGGDFHDEGWRVRSDGSRFWAEVYTAPLHDEAGNLRGFSKVIRDVSGRKHAERRLVAQHSVTRILAEAETLGEATRRILPAVCGSLIWQVGALWTVDRQAGVTRCIEVWHAPDVAVPAFEAMTREITFAPGVGLPGRVWADRQAHWVANVVTDPNFPRALVAAREQLHSAVAFPILLGAEVLGVIEFFNAAIQQPDADLLDMFAAIGSQIGQFIERKRAEQAVRQSEARKTAMLESALDAVITIDQTGIILECNPAAEQTFGLARTEMIGKEMAELLIPPHMRAAHRQGLAHYLATGEGPLLGKRVEVPALHATRGEFSIEVSITRIPLDGAPMFTAYVRDITERKRAEEERARLLARERAARADAESANRMKDEFLASVSHELRTPLSAILAWSGLLRTGRLDAATSGRALETIERSTKLQAQLIGDLLDISRIVTGKLRLNVRPIELGPIVEAAIEAVRPAAEAKAIRIEPPREATVGPISGDPDRVQQILWNLLSNAVKFTSRGGCIRVELERTESRAQIRVSDTGKGISADFLPYVFDRFRQADSSSTRAHGGLGLGLAIVRHLVELQGGTVEAESPGEGHGATFRVSLPLLAVQRDEADQPSETGLHHTPALDGVRVLVVDDEGDARDYISFILEQRGADVTAAASVREALETLERIHPDVLLSDIGMAGEDGYALIRRVRALDVTQGGEIPAAALTAYARNEDRSRALSAGYQLHVAKPVDPVELIAVVAQLARRAPAM